jgi:hypothetical protein
VTGEQPDFRMGRGPSLQAGNMRSENQTIELLRCKVESGIGWQGVGAVEKPPIVVMNGDPTVAAGMTEERHEIHLWGEREPDGFKPKPLCIGLFV